MNHDAILAIDIGGTKTAIGVMTASDAVCHTARFSTPQDPVLLIQEIKRYLADQKTVRFRGIGIGVAGQVNGDLAPLGFCPNLPQYEGFALGAEIRTLFSTDVVVRMENDGNLFAFAECCRRPDVSELIGLTIGTGLGGGVISNSRILRGAGSGGEVGHIVLYPEGRRCACGNAGCAEAYLSGTAVEKIASERGVSDKSASEILQSGNEGTEENICSEFVSNFSHLIVSMVNLHDPQVIVVGGGAVADFTVCERALGMAQGRFFGGARSGLKIEPAWAVGNRVFSAAWYLLERADIV
jgi:glucokinase